MTQSQIEWCRERLKTSASNTFAEMEARRVKRAKKEVSDGGFDLSSAQAGH